METGIEITVKGFGPSKGDCTEIDEIDFSEWFRLGGTDIAVWDTEYTLIGTQPAIDYACGKIGITISD